MRQVILNRGNHKLIFIDKKIFISKNFSRGKTEESSISVSLHAYAPIKCPSIKFFYEIFHMLWKDGIITHLKQRHKMWNMPLKWLTIPLSPLQLEKRVSHNAASARRASTPTANVWMQHEYLVCAFHSPAYSMLLKKFALSAQMNSKKNKKVVSSK